jgi:protein TonB
MRGWEGSVTMRLRVAPSGRLIDAELHTSSGHDVLDRQALAMASQAQRLPAPPDGLNGGEIAVLVPVVFRLEP